MPNKVDIIISLVEWRGVNNERRLGLTSNYYKTIFDNFNLNFNETIKTSSRLIVRDSHFRLPEDTSSNMLMICTGTGIAPYISFLQEFEYKKHTHNHEVNPNCLVFGSRNRHFDFIYENDLVKFNDKKILHDLVTTFSRDQSDKRYVQHLVEEMKEKLEKLLENNGRIYICGGVAMGGEVVSTLNRMFGTDYVKKLEADNKIIKELWG